MNLRPGKSGHTLIRNEELGKVDQFGGGGDAFTFTGKDLAGLVWTWRVHELGTGVCYWVCPGFWLPVNVCEKLQNDTITIKSVQREGRVVIRGRMNQKKFFW